MSLTPPFALFILSKDIENEYINDALTRAYNGNFQAGWDLWLSPSPTTYDSIPKTLPENRIPDGTQPPIPPSFASAWIGKTVEQAAEYLRQAPDDAAVNRRFFTVMDEHSKAEDYVLVCRVVEGEGEGWKVEYFPQPTGSVAMEMQTNGDGKFEEKAGNYQKSRMRDGMPDRSRAGPYT